METNYITLTKENIANEHICCAFSDKKCKDSYELKKEWLKKEFDNGYVFRRIDERAKVFIEYGPAEKAWVPVNAPNYLMINCFWVSGKYKGCGHGKALLQSAIDDAKSQGKEDFVDGLVHDAGHAQHEQRPRVDNHLTPQAAVKTPAEATQLGEEQQEHRA